MKASRHIRLVFTLMLTLALALPRVEAAVSENRDTTRIDTLAAEAAQSVEKVDADAAKETAAENKSEEAIDVKGIVLGHLADSYEWHITTWGHTHITIPLPVIVHGSDGQWHLFSSSHLSHGESYEGFYIAQSGEHEGKIVELNAQGEEVRPLDLSITKTVLALLINSTLLVLIILGTARWYKKRTARTAAPGGFVGLMEMAIMMIHDDLIKSCVGKDYKRYAPYLLTAFFFILINNLMGLIPIFPGGANVTGNIAITFLLALATFLMTNLFGSREYWKEVFWPEVPTWLKCPVPMMPLIEFVGLFTKPFALMIRLFANMMAGHAVILSLTCLVFVTASMGAAINGTMTVVSVIFCIFMNMLELLVAFIQAYVFTMLSAVFIGLSRVESHHKKEETEA
jgi:F-type H+-transporting ATPase subunit a